jgi:peptide/nickel transport system substrate-binding protein
LTGYEPGKEIRLVRNPNWDSSSDARPAYADRITVKEGYADSASASRQILTGEGQVNGDFGPPPSVLREAATRYKEQLSLPTSGGSRYVSLNTQLAPLDDLNVRKAVLAATNREALRLTAGGEAAGAIANHFIPPDIPGFEEAGGFDGTGADFLEKPAGDLALAAEYMKKAGYKSGKYDGNDELLMVGDDSASSRQIGEIMLDTFQKLGFKVNYRPVSQEIMYTKFCGTPAAKVAICATTGWLKDFNDAESLLDPTFNGNNILPSNNVNWPQLDVKSINDAMAKAALLTDQDERTKAWADIDRQITAQAPALPWIWDNSPVIWSENVAPVINLFNATADLSYTSLKK